MAWPLYAGVCLLGILPFLLFPTPPIVDFANHAARLHLACHAADADVAAMYRFRLGLIPNLAVDLVNLSACGVIPPGLLLRLVIAAALAAICGGCWRVQRAAAGGTNPAILLVPALAMNLVTMTGYVNFLVGAAIAINLAAMLVARPRSPGALVAIGNMAGVALFFAHIFALATAVALVFGWHMTGQRPRPRPLARAGIRTAAMFALPLALLPFVAQEHTPYDIRPLAKLRTLIAPFLTYGSVADLACMIATIVPVYLLLRIGRLRIVPPLRGMLWALAAYVVAAPPQLRAAVDIDARSAVVLAWLFVAALGMKRPDRAAGGTLTALAAGLLAIHGGMAVVRWPAYAAEVRDARAAFAALPAGARLLSVYATGDGGTPTIPPAYLHMTSYATLDRHVFNPLDFTGTGMQPMAPTPAYAAIDVGAGQPLPLSVMRRLAAPDRRATRWASANGISYALRWLGRFDHLVLYRFDGAAEIRHPRLRPVARTARLTVYRILPAAGD